MNLSPLIFQDQFSIIQNLQTSPIPKTSFLPWTFFCRFLQQYCSNKQELKVPGKEIWFIFLSEFNLDTLTIKPEKSPAILIHACRQEKSKSFIILIEDIFQSSSKFFTYVTKTRLNLSTHSRKPGNHNCIIIFEIDIMKKSSPNHLKFTCQSKCHFFFWCNQLLLSVTQ